MPLKSLFKVVSFFFSFLKELYIDQHFSAHVAHMNRIIVRNLNRMGFFLALVL